MSPQEEENHRQFLGLFMAHESAIYAYVRRLVPHQQDGRDVMQEVALVLWKKFDQYDPGKDFRGWAFGVARFQVLAWRRDLAREQQRIVLSGETIELMADEQDQQIDQLDLEREAILQHCLGELDRDQRSAVAAMYSNSKIPTEKLAKQFGKTPTSFYQWIYRIRQSLTKCAQRVANQSTC